MSKRFSKCLNCGSEEQSISTDCGPNDTGVRMHYVVCHKCGTKGPRGILADEAEAFWNIAQQKSIESNNACYGCVSYKQPVFSGRDWCLTCPKNIVEGVGIYQSLKDMEALLSGYTDSKISQAKGFLGAVINVLEGGER